MSGARSGIILVPVDNTEAATLVVEYVLSEIYREGDVVHLLHIVPIPMPESFSTGLDTIAALEPDMEADAEAIRHAKSFIRSRFLGLLEERGVAYKVDIIHFLTDEDSIGQAICERADVLKPRVVVMAKHQRGRIEEFFLGSAAKHVAGKCRYPLTLLHEQVAMGTAARASLSPTSAAASAGNRSQERITGY